MRSWGVVRKGAATSFDRRVLLATVTSLVLAAACAGEAGVDSAVRTEPLVTPGDSQAGTSSEITPDPATGADLFLVDPESGHVTELVVAEGDQTDPERSPTGRHVVYEGEIAGSKPQIFVLEADGTERMLTHMPSGAQDPTWSPDGRRIAFASSGPHGDIFVMNADGTDIRRLAGTPKRDVAPDWFPDGTRIVFNTLCGESRECRSWPVKGEGRSFLSWSGIWMTSAADGSLTQLTENNELDGDYSAAWSPGGQWIAFIRWEHPGAPPREYPFFGERGLTGLWLMRPDGTEQHRLVEYWGHLDSPTWSPNGRSIAFLDWHHERTIRVADVAEEQVRSLRTGAIVHELTWGTHGILGSVGGDPA